MPAADASDLLAQIRKGGDATEQGDLIAAYILQGFDGYYLDSRKIPAQAQLAFEQRQHGESLSLSRRRLSLYIERILALLPPLQDALPRLAGEEALWQEVEKHYLRRITGRYEADLAFAFLHSLRRKIYRDDWQPVEYGFGEATGDFFAEIYSDYVGGPQLSPVTVAEILSIPYFAAPYRDAQGDAELVAERVNAALNLDGLEPGAIQSVEVINAGFFRNRGAYLVGRLVMKDDRIVPLIIALLNSAEGIYVDAVMTAEADAHNIFSSTLANFHVTNLYYHELCEFLHSIMPNRPIGLHYSTIGFNHTGKVAVMNELKDELANSGERFETAVGFRGTVAIGFSAPSSAYVLKVLRDAPTAQYKWGHYEGVETVLKKYTRVHEINRTGSMLDSIIYYNVTLEKDWFDPELLQEILEAAPGSVTLREGAVVFRHLITQMKMVPLPVFLEDAEADQAAAVVTNLGHCIKNNAAANIFNKDLDGRNYGVSSFLKVYLFDYDALEPFTDIKIRTNQDRFDGEDEVPDWFFEEGVVFLPEEMESGLRIPDRQLRRLFRNVHGDLLTTGYWETVQRDLRDGKVPRVSVYPDSRRLVRDEGA